MDWRVEENEFLSSLILSAGRLTKGMVAASL